MSSKNLNVFYIPVGLTSFQKDLIEILISIHSKAFKTELGIGEGDSVKAEEDRKDTNTSLTTLSNIQMTYMFDSGIWSVLNHPCLIVDHYMPRQFLLMEPTERLINSSDKFKQLDMFLTSLLSRNRTTFPGVVKIALVSHGVRELDLLESYILGKKLKILRLSGKSLYKEGYQYPVSSENNKQKSKRRKKDSSSDSSSSHDSSPNTTAANRYTGYAKDDYDYSSKRNKNLDSKEEKEDWIFLTTSNHLLNNPKLLSEYDIDIIISFDPLLDPNMEAFKNIKNLKNNKTAKKLSIIKLVVKDSPDHFILHKKMSYKKDNYQNILKSITHFLLTRESVIPTTTIACKSNEKIETTERYPKIAYREFIEKLLLGEDIKRILPELELSTNTHLNDEDEILKCCKSTLCPLDYSDLQLDNDTTITNIKTYQSTLMKRTIERMKSLQNDYGIKKNIILNKRVEETNIQNSFDELKHSIGETFKKSQEMEKLANNSEKTLEKAQSEKDKLKAKLTKLQSKKLELSKLLSAETDSAVSDLKTNYLSQIENFTKEFEQIKKINDDLSKKNDDLRLDYQQKSSKAAELAQTLKSEIERHDSLKKLLEGPTASLEYQSAVDLEKRLLNDKLNLKNENNLLKSYMEQVKKQYEANRTGGLKATSSSSATNSPNSSSSDTPSNQTSTNKYGRQRSTR
ncbi:hypothetical protein TPHA_0D01850 [Tetrapisispora phaffii CBS 4417]|uniref:HDA1 complex subunit 2 n=1 Tax=Tetrapisispora phaffii (strain ATCC 24235 / CBS 4417 / NBRC 1672 / NRRL Y-8282 / UCD 70-5) TaxID=1071381 RepID=G8BSK3_TETPH|nr:hypothetical protein TPHA_0D01850 [Tetrapisispora phaffii CBS 4417]CCE62824.1 hypothetical protein TPHA_0D01850 [Tetrapisispora phaffii CBS 4417]